jgi:hypothetical protein
MSIIELGALGELIGSAAVLVTLVYLAYQTRQNRLALEQQTKAQTAAMAQANMGLWHNLYGKVLESPDVARIFGNIKAGREVPAEDAERLGALLVMWVLNLENLVFQSRLNPFVEDIDRVLERIFSDNVALFLASPSSLAWWESSRGLFGPEVVSRIDAALPAAAIGHAGDRGAGPRGGLPAPENE